MIWFPKKQDERITIRRCAHVDKPWNFWRFRSKIREFYNWHLSNFHTWCQSCCTRLKLDVSLDVVPTVCVFQVLVYARSCPIFTQYLSNPSQLQRGKKVASLCNYLLSCGFSDRIHGKRCLCFVALQGESIENFLSDFIMCRLFYWCAPSILGFWRQPQSLWPELSYVKARR